MATVTVRYWAAAKQAAGVAEEVLTAGTLAELLAAGLALAPVALEQLAGGDAGDNAAMLARLLEGEPGPRREAVLLNAGMALVVEGRAGSLAEGYALSRDSIESGAAAGCFQRMKEASRAA